MPTWMTTLWNGTPGFQTRPLNQITIPGTHDAGCYIDRGLGRNFLARTQSQDIAQQLLGGIRYFDLRPAQGSWVAGRSFYAYHGPYWGGRIDGPGGILDDVANFMAGLAPGDRELVILNFSHFYSFGNQDHIALIGEIQNRLGPHLVRYDQSQVNLFNTPYWQLLADPAPGGLPPAALVGATLRSRVAVLYDGALDTDPEAYITANVNALNAGFFTLSPKYLPAAAANRIYLFDQYANAVGIGAMQVDQIAKLRNRAAYPYSRQPWMAQLPPGAPTHWNANAAGGVASTLHLFSWTLTPQPLLRDPISVAASQSNPAALVAFSNVVAGWAGANGNYDPALDPKINIFYVDDYASTPYNNNPPSPWNNVAVPVAIAARLNAGALWPTNW